MPPFYIVMDKGFKLKKGRKMNRPSFFCDN